MRPPLGPTHKPNIAASPKSAIKSSKKVHFPRNSNWMKEIRRYQTKPENAAESQVRNRWFRRKRWRQWSRRRYASNTTSK
ncbi:unnamed protein product [Oppiella nova]|uniref:Uncharacterized protein n=1 Tax=Oppiella nova TaxID=334625 RepID=A0A7R9MFK6_9ACAR|nr:unnamed protein product [Oppiella nova]CAG2176158.1 unnamed protein product [Oppiella nova]